MSDNAKIVLLCLLFVVAGAIIRDGFAWDERYGIPYVQQQLGVDHEPVLSRRVS